MMQETPEQLTVALPPGSSQRTAVVLQQHSLRKQSNAQKSQRKIYISTTLAIQKTHDTKSPDKCSTLMNLSQIYIDNIYYTFAIQSQETVLKLRKSTVKQCLPVNKYQF